MTDQPYRVVGQPAVYADQVTAIRRLEATCNAAEGLVLKLAVDTTPGPGSSPRERSEERAPISPDVHAGEERSGMGPEDAPPRAFLARAPVTPDDDPASPPPIVGYCALDYYGGDEAEVCGMVHPEHRRRGVGRALLDAVRAACPRHGISRLLLICEDAARSGQAFVAAAGARRAFAELHLELDAAAPPPGPAAPPGFTFRRAAPGDEAALARIMGAAFDEPVDEAYGRAAAGLQDGDARFYLGLLDGVAVGSLKVYLSHPPAGIYAFGVLPAHRGRGLGRQILAHTIAALRAEGWTRFALEVAPDNAPAVALYRSLGFADATTYGYFALEV